MNLPNKLTMIRILMIPLFVVCFYLPSSWVIGTLNGVSIHPRDVFSIAVRWNAHAILVAHNHPSGSSAPSKRDVELTWGLYGAGKMMGIPLLDHLILTVRSHYSFADNGKLGE